jgi:hypothetical protein
VSFERDRNFEEGREISKLMENIIQPPPNQFTHELTQDEPYYFDGPQQQRPPDGTFPSGTKVVLMVYDGGSYCRVADGKGVYAVTAYYSLKQL